MSTMATNINRRAEYSAAQVPLGDEVGALPHIPSAVSWGAILAGAAGAAALSLILLILGTGLGLSSVSPWAQEGIGATAFGVSTIVWITLTQLLASGMGGYLAGRLRTKWVDAQTDEVYFRDTAHGFLAWAVASLATAALLASAVGAIVSGGAQAGATVAAGAATAAAGVAGGAAAADSTNSNPGESLDYFVDKLLRRDGAAPAATLSPDGQGAAAPAEQNSAEATAEAAAIFANGVRMGALPADDVRYLGQLIAAHTDLTQQQAEQRVNETFASVQATLQEAKTAAQQTADDAREISAYASLWLFVSLLIGAFVASLAATYGGRQRDL